MSDIKTAFVSAATITCTLTSLASSGTAGRETATVDNSSNKYLDALVTCKIKTQNSGSIAAPSAVFVWLAASIDTGTEWPDAITGADAAITFNNPTQLKLLGTIYVAAINTIYKGGPWSVAALFGGRLPEKWSLAIQNNCGTALTATSTDHTVRYQGVYATLI